MCTFLLPHLHLAIAAVPRAALFYCQNTSVAASLAVSVYNALLMCANITLSVNLLLELLNLPLLTGATGSDNARSRISASDVFTYRAAHFHAHFPARYHENGLNVNEV
jgi:hypothetical protein